MLWWTQRQLRSNNAEKRKLAVQRLGDLRDRRALAPLVVALRDADEDVQKAATRALDSCVDLLSTALEDKAEDKDIRLVAALRLGETGDSRFVKPLLQAAVLGGSEVSGAAAEALGKLGSAAVEPLVAEFRKSGAAARQVSAEALAMAVQGARMDATHKWAMVSGFLWFQREAAKALGRIRDARAVEPLVSALGKATRIPARQ